MVVPQVEVLLPYALLMSLPVYRMAISGGAEVINLQKAFSPLFAALHDKM